MAGDGPDTDFPILLSACSQSPPSSPLHGPSRESALLGKFWFYCCLSAGYSCYIMAIYACFPSKALEIEFEFCQIPIKRF